MQERRPVEGDFLDPEAADRCEAGDRYEEREAAAQEDLAKQRAKVEGILAMKRNALHSPQGLMGLFPTNKVKLRIVSSAQRRKEAEERLRALGRLA